VEARGQAELDPAEKHRVQANSLPDPVT